MSGIHAISAGCLVFVLMGTFLPPSESLPQGGNLQDSLPASNCQFLASLTGLVDPACPPKTTTVTTAPKQSCQCAPISRCLDGRPPNGGTNPTPVSPPAPLGQDNGDPIIVGVGDIGIRTGPNHGGNPTDRSNVVIDIGDRTISPCGDILSVCCDNIEPEESTPHPTPPPTNTFAQCGIRNTNGVGVTITGFQDGQAQLSEFPWMVAVLGPDTIYVGGGSLVHGRAILTAAHKVNGVEGQLVARIGDWDLFATSEPIASQNVKVQKVLYHPKFNKQTLVYDVALLILETHATLGDTVMPVCLPEINQEFAGSNCFVTGWGKDVFGKTGQYQKIMKKVSVPAISHSQCQNMLRNTRLGNTFTLADTFNCAGGQGEDACEGDGGSPLVCPHPNNSGQYVQMGVVAWGIGCGEVGNPGVYGSIPKTVKWIRDTIQKEVGFNIRTPSQDDGGRGK